MNEVPYAILQFLVDYPFLVWVWLGATVGAVVLRAMYPETSERPRWVVGILALTDLLQLNLSGPTKLLAAKGKDNLEPKP